MTDPPTDAQAETLIATVERACADGDTDPGGAVSPREVARRTEWAEKTVSTWLGMLVDEGRLLRRWGIGAETNRPRQSYAPPESNVGAVEEVADD